MTKPPSLPLFLVALTVLLLLTIPSGAQQQQQQTIEDVLPAVEDVGRLGLFMVKRIWAGFGVVAAHSGSGMSIMDVLGGLASTRQLKLVLDTIGLGLEPTFAHLQQLPTFDEFEDWIEANAVNLQSDTINRLNAMVSGGPIPEATRQLLQEIDEMENVLTEEDLEHWEREGYVILHNAIPTDDQEATRNVIWNFIGASPDHPDSWYHTQNQKGINVQLYDHVVLDKNRKSKRIHKAYAQLWNSTDLYMSTDRASFNPPERQGEFQFPGPHMHWDALLMPPLPMSTQGLLYLNDVEPHQGAFTLVPGFHRRIDDWLWEIAAYGGHPQDADFEALGATPIAGKAGDLIIWDHRLPHGGRPNTATFPRMVQYLNMLPGNICEHQPKPLPEQSCNAYGQCSTGECSSQPAQIMQ